MELDDRLRVPGGPGGVLGAGAGLCGEARTGGFGSWEEWFSHHEVPRDEWDDGAYLSDPDGAGPALSFLKVPEPKAVKNRLHLDVRVGGGRETPWEVRWPRVVEAVERLTAAGATVVREEGLGAGRITW